MLSRHFAFTEACDTSKGPRGKFRSAPQKQGLETEMSRVH